MKTIIVALYCLCGSAPQLAAQRFVSTAPNLLGQPAPEFALPLFGPTARQELRGAVALDSIRLANYRGKVVFLNFWFTSCGPCVAENPEFERLSRELAPSGVQFIGVSFGEPLKRLRSYMAMARLTFPQAIDSRATIALRYGVVAAPTSYAIDTAGVVRAQYDGGPLGANQVLEMLARAGFKPTAAPKVAH